MAEGADNLDHVSDAEEAFRQAAIRHVRLKDDTPRDFDGTSCYDCEELIPEGRLKLGKYTCISCQTIREKQSR